MNKSTSRKTAVSRNDFRPITVRNVITGETYVTCKAYDKRVIEGVEFTQVLHNKRLQLVRSDSLKKIKDPQTIA